MPSIQPVNETIAGAIRNALYIADLWKDEVLRLPAGEHSQALHDIVRLLRQALIELSEPNLAAMRAGEILLREWNGTPEPMRRLRDTIAGILNAQLTGNVPKTWSPE